MTGPLTIAQYTALMSEIYQVISGEACEALSPIIEESSQEGEFSDNEDDFEEERQGSDKALRLECLQVPDVSSDLLSSSNIK